MDVAILSTLQNLSTPQKFAIWLLPVLFAIVFHEVAHGWVADKLGDKTARMLGRLTLNPSKHIDPIGTLLIPGFLLLTHAGFLFGWAKPVPITTRNLRNPKIGMALVALAGPMSNFLMAIFWALIAKLALPFFAQGSDLGLQFTLTGLAGIWINLLLMVLNLLPLPPLDGGRIVSSLLPGRMAYQYDKIERFGFFILIGLMLTDILSSIMMPPIMFLLNLIGTSFVLPTGLLQALL